MFQLNISDYSTVNDMLNAMWVRAKAQGIYNGFFIGATPSDMVLPNIPSGTRMNSSGFYSAMAWNDATPFIKIVLQDIYDNTSRMYHIGGQWNGANLKWEITFVNKINVT